jgi:hypothetical protein
MKQKRLIIAIVAVAAVVVVIGLWLAGTAGSGPLAGTISPIKTTLTLTATEVAGCEGGIMQRSIQFSGTLEDENGNPIPVRPVTIYNADGPDIVTTINTDLNGTFSEQKGQGCCPITYYAVFVSGSPQYQNAESASVSVPASNYC